MRTQFFMASSAPCMAELFQRLQAIEERLKNVESSQAELKTDLKNLQEMLTQEDEGANGPLLPLA